MFHSHILSKKQLSILGKLESFATKNIYLAGGTALALQIGHRTSIDFDFYNQEYLDPNKLLPELKKKSRKIEVLDLAEDTLIVNFEDVHLSLFYYPYKLIRPLKKFKNIYLSSPEDIACMKIAAIIQRGRRRDFIDIYYLIKRFSLKRIIELTMKKYPGYQEMIILRALIYFEEAEKDLGRGIRIFDEDFSWEKAKKKIFVEVKKFQLEMIKK